MPGLNKITFHWTAGTHKPHLSECCFYHFLIDKDGNITNGNLKPEANINCNDGNYVPHCGGGNTGNIGIAFCGCYVPKGVPVQKSEYPLTRVQLERGFKLAAELCKKYNIPVDPQHVFTHYEFGKANPRTSSAGKIDIIYMAPFPDISAAACGDFIRNKVRWYFKSL